MAADQGGVAVEGRARGGRRREQRDPYVLGGVPEIREVHVALVDLLVALVQKINVHGVSPGPPGPRGRMARRRIDLAVGLLG
ncbi:hypothetical protein [Streptomyces marianii]|uniref:Uncharacterized protein n=1 Tax=Streptomyces marianii TaxID=1817406 RepID=A0A5R9EJ17_9ACTN|nr:hypothetical protein [Streptomyces marianii]TLQ47843.1 hypothetical protein FEF34_37410 [Streptomyces marianii]